MIIKFAKDGRSGACEYMQNGTAGDRNKKDKRIQLTLQDCKQIIDKTIEESKKQGKNYKDNYKHIILSFAELEELNEQTLRNVAADFVNLYMQGYKQEDYNYYAEAHIPIKEINESGERRHQHLHVFIPKYSCVLGKKLDFGRTDYRQKEIEIIKKILIKKYNLQETDKRKIIDKEKYKKNRNYSNVNLKLKILEKIEEKIKSDEIKNYDEMLYYINSNFGTIVKFSSEKAKTAYITIKIKDKKIRLKGELFSRQQFNKCVKELKNGKTYIQKEQLNKNEELAELYKKLYKLQRKRIDYIQKRYYKNNYNKEFKKEKIKWEQKIKYKGATEDFDKKLYVLTKLLQQDYKKAKNTNINLQGYFFKETEKENNEKEILVANKQKNIYIKIRKNEIVSNSNSLNAKEQAEQMFKLLILQGKDPISSEAEGSLEFRLHFKKLQQEFLKNEINKIKQQKTKKEAAEITI